MSNFNDVISNQSCPKGFVRLGAIIPLDYRYSTCIHIPQTRPMYKFNFNIKLQETISC